MVLARFSDNDVELIGCGTRFYDDGFMFGFCRATDLDGVEIVCWTMNPDFMNAISAISPFSFILFESNTDGDCTTVRFSTQSHQIPDLKKSK